MYIQIHTYVHPYKCTHVGPPALAHLLLLLLRGGAAGGKEVLLAQELRLDLSCLGIAQHCVVGWEGSEGLNLRPAHEVKGSHVLVEEHLVEGEEGGEGRGGEGRGGGRGGRGGEGRGRKREE